MVPVEACEILETWDGMGMRGTGSDAMGLTDVFVPQARTLPLVPEFTPGAPSRGPLCPFSAMGINAATFPSVVLAMARQALEAMYALAQGKTPFASPTVLRERGTAQAPLAQAAGALRAARVFLYDTRGEVWEQTLAGEPPSLVQRADLLLAVAHATRSAAQVVETAYNVPGTSGIYTRTPLERHCRDLQVLKQHGSLNFSQFVARQYWWKRGATRYRFRAHGVENGACSSGASRSLWINYNHLQMLIN
jgi:alkylation response protein AidB-like acyl-CoA dehydrogenase